MGSSSFHHAVAPLMMQLGIDGFPEQVAASDDVCSITTQGTTVHLVGAQEGFLHMWSFLGKLPQNVSRKSLVALLAANSVTLEHPAFHIGLEPATGELVLWTRELLNELDAVRINDLFDLFMDIAQQMKHWNDEGASPPDFRSFQDE